MHRYDTLITFDDETRLDTVPTLYQGPFSLETIDGLLRFLDNTGSVAAPGYRNPEGVIAFHTGGRGDTFKAFVEDLVDR